jgi:4-oxalocrotonate tautomerase
MALRLVCRVSVLESPLRINPNRSLLPKKKPGSRRPVCTSGIFSLAVQRQIVILAVKDLTTKLLLRRELMPYVNIKITREQEALTAEQKAALINGVTDLLVDVVNRGPKTTVVVIDEIDTDNYGAGGETITERRSHGL